MIDGITDSVTVTVDPAATVEWLPPLTNMDEFVVQDGRTLPLKFQMLAAGHPVEEAVAGTYLVVEDASRNEVVGWDLGEGRDALRFDAEDFHYVASFHTRDHALVDGQTYTAIVFDSDENELRRISFEVSTNKGVGRGRGRQ